MYEKGGKVFINGRMVVTSACGGVSTAMPNVCKTPTPGGPVPTPYPNVAKAEDLMDCCPTVRINGAPVMTAASKIRKSYGDEPGSLGGIISAAKSGTAKALTDSSNVTIGGYGVVREHDIISQNDGNAVGSILLSGETSQSTGPEKEQVKASSVICAICESDEHETPESDREGSHKENRSKLRRALRKAHNLKKNFKKHPWYIKPKSVHGHHLIDCAAMNKGKCWERYCKSFGYDINTIKNGVSPPSDEEVACVLAVPQHCGNHDDGYIYDEGGRRISLGQGDVGEEEYLCYPAAVSDRIRIIREHAEKGRFCDSPDNFVMKMNEASAKIFKEVKSFTWTLREDGRNLHPSETGCLQHEPKQKDDSGTHIRLRGSSHQNIRKILAERETHSLQLGK